MACAPQDIQVLSGYDAQVKCVQRLLRSSGLGRCIVQSVDKAQGSEARVVIYSTVRCNKEGALGFIEDARRLNVAVTRAREGLIIIGHFQTLTRTDP